MKTNQFLGLCLKNLGEQLIDDDSELNREFRLSDQQVESITRVVRILSSPAVQVLYLSDLAMRWKVTNRTVQNWMHNGYVPTGKISEGDTRMHWMDWEVEEIENNLLKMGIIKKEKPRGAISRLVSRVMSLI